MNIDSLSINISEEIYRKLKNNIQPILDNLGANKLVNYYADTNNYKDITSINGKIIDITYGDGVYVTTYESDESKICMSYSSDLNEWTSIISNMNSFPEHKIVYAGGVFLLVCANGKIFKLNDNLSYNINAFYENDKDTNNNKYTFTDANYDEDRKILIIIGKDDNKPTIFTLPISEIRNDNISDIKNKFQLPGGATTITFNSIACGKEGVVVVGNDSYNQAYIYCSYDGYIWNNVIIGNQVYKLTSVRYYYGTIIAIGYVDGINELACFVSYDMLAWERFIPSEFSNSITCKAEYLEICGDEFIISSTDTTYTPLVSNDLRSYKEYNSELKGCMLKMVGGKLFAFGNGVFKYSDCTIKFARTIWADNHIRSDNRTGSIIVSRSPYKDPFSYLGFGYWKLCERCDGVCEYTRLL